ncbi:MAG: UDP-2,3-diacylglucosamine diphosphatase, partial [Saprospiraceae bacterium]
YLKSITPKTLIINGDFIDGWAFSKSYFPEVHFEVIRYILKMLNRGTKIIYITGNHDEFLRYCSDVVIGKIQIVDKYILDMDGLKYWFFHGDVFDYSTKGFNKYIAKIGGKGYDWLIVFNRIINHILLKLGKEKYSLSKKIKNVVKHAVKFIHDFEEKAAENAIRHGFDYVVCGHIHQPQIKEYRNSEGKVIYLNSGDWIENLSSLEYSEGEWKLFYFPNKITKKFKNAPKKDFLVGLSQPDFIHN